MKTTIHLVLAICLVFAVVAGCKKNTPPSDGKTTTSPKPLTSEDLTVVEKAQEFLAKGNYDQAIEITKKQPSLRILTDTFSFSRKVMGNLQATSLTTDPSGTATGGQETLVVGDEAIPADLYPQLVEKSVPIEVVAALLYDPYPPIRYVAAGVLEERGENAGVPRLIELLSSKDILMVNKAARALAAIKDRRAIEPLRQLAASNDTERRELAIECLKRMDVEY